MLTLAILRQRKIVVPWELPGDAIGGRTFLYTALWRRQFNALPGGKRGPGLRFTPGFRDNLSALINQFVANTKKSRLIRPHGEGSEPIFRRMRAPNTCTFEFCTYDTRTFGFFAGVNSFVAMTVGETDRIKAEQLYLSHALDVAKLMSRLSPSEYDCRSDLHDLFTD